MLKHKAKNCGSRKNRLLQQRFYVGRNSHHPIWTCNLLSLAWFIIMFLLVSLALGIGCFDCFRQLGCDWLCHLNIRSFPGGNILANFINWLTGSLASIFCVPKDGSLLIQLSTNQITLSTEASSLSLAPAQIVLTTIGTGGVTLSAISEFRARRYLGVPMRDVLHHYYPGHVYFVLMHILLYVLGVFAIEKGMIRCSMLALLGIILCCMYAVVFSFGSFSSETLTKAYIGAIAKKKCNSYNDLHASMINNIAFHISTEYSKNGRELINWFKTYGLTFVQLLDAFLLNKQRKSQQCSLSNRSVWDEKLIFKQVFCISEDPCIKSDPADWVFYRLLMKHKKQQSYASYLAAKIKNMQLVWGNLFHPFDGDVDGQAEVAAALLTASYIHSYPLFMTMVCALSLYQHDREPNESSTQNISNFLWQILKHSQHLQENLCKNPKWIIQKRTKHYQFKEHKEGWAAYRKALGLIECSVTLWESALYGRDAKDNSTVYNELLEVADSTNFFDLEISRQELRLYMAYGYVTYLTALPAPSLYPSRNHMLPLLYRLEEIFYRKIVAVN